MTEAQRRAAYEGWVRAYGAELFRCAYRLTGRQQRAEDLVQETFVEAWRSAAKLRDENRARAWLFQILRHRHLHGLRDHKRRMEGQPGRVPLDCDVQAQREGHEFDECDSIQVALAGLNEALRETFVLVVMGGFTTREAAEQLRVPPGTILSRLHRAREHLRGILRGRAFRRRESEMTREDGQDRAFQERMEQASLLPEHDPVRVAVADEVALRGGKEGVAGREWFRLLDERERLKRVLESVSVPPDLEQRWLRIPQAKAMSWRQRPMGELVTRKVMATAAAVILIAAAGWWGVTALMAYREARQLLRVAEAAADIRRTLMTHPPAERIETSDRGAAAAWLKSRVGFRVLMLSGTGVHLTSASVVPLNKAPAVLTTWQKDGHQYSLLQFVPASVGVAGDFAKRTVVGGGYDVDMWAEPSRGCGWALVMDPGTGNPFIY